jgi:hypothetical protein
MAIETEKLLSRMILNAITNHPLPWTVEEDWTMEVTDASGHIVVKCQSAEEASAIINLAQELNEELAKAEISFAAAQEASA